MLLNIIICDDDNEDIADMKKKLKELSLVLNINLNIATFDSAEKLLCAFKEKQGCDVLFIDIELGEDNGIKIVQKIRFQMDLPPEIVFVSNYPEYMYDSFCVHPYQFIMKPVNTSCLNALMYDLIYDFKKKEREITVIQGSICDHTINISQLLYIEIVDSKKKGLLFHMKKQSVMTSGTLQVWKDRLKNSGFMMANRSTLINIFHIHYIEGNSIVMDNGEKVLLSRRTKKEITNHYLNQVVRFDPDNS